MLALSSHHHVERTPEGEDAWRNMSMLPDDRRLLGALRTVLRVSALLSEHNFEPSTLEVVLHRLARRGHIRIVTDLPVTDVVVEPPAMEPAVAVPDAASALSSLLARKSQEPLPGPADPVSAPESTHAPVTPSIPAQAPPAAAVPALPADESPLPLSTSPADLGALMKALRQGPEAAQSSSSKALELAPAEAPSETAYSQRDLTDLMSALLGGNKPSKDDKPSSSSRSSSGAPPHPSAGAPGFLRIKDVSASSPRDRLAPLASLPKKRTRAEIAEDQRQIAEAQRAHALKKRQEREANEAARRAEMAERRKNEQKKDESTSFMGMSERLKRVRAGKDEN